MTFYETIILRQLTIEFCAKNVQKFIHHEDHEEHEEIIKPLETHFSCPSCASW